MRTRSDHGHRWGDGLAACRQEGRPSRPGRATCRPERVGAGGKVYVPAGRVCTVAPLGTENVDAGGLAVNAVSVTVVPFVLE